jgi:hypothetical protein
MSLALSDDLRQALASEGTPLKLVDPQTGETYLVVRESSLKEQAAQSEAEKELEKVQISNERLRQLAEKHRPPQEWFESEEENLFE